MLICKIEDEQIPEIPHSGQQKLLVILFSIYFLISLVFYGAAVCLFYDSLNFFFFTHLAHLLSM